MGKYNWAGNETSDEKRDHGNEGNYCPKISIPECIPLLPSGANESQDTGLAGRAGEGKGLEWNGRE